MARQVFFNNADTATLSAPISASAVSFTLQAGEGDSVFPMESGEYFYATIGTEVVWVTERTGDTFTCAETVSGWPAGTPVVQYITAQMMDEMAQLDGDGGYLKNYVFMDYTDEKTTISSVTSNTINLDLSYPYHVVNLTANVTTITFSNLPSDGVGSYVIEFVQDSSGGKTVTWPASVKTPNDVPIAIGSGANAISIVVLMTRDAGTTFYAGLFGVNFA